jgi:hypothetical protein
MDIQKNHILNDLFDIAVLLIFHIAQLRQLPEIWQPCSHLLIAQRSEDGRG